MTVETFNMCFSIDIRVDATEATLYLSSHNSQITFQITDSKGGDCSAALAYDDAKELATAFSQIVQMQGLGESKD